MGDHRTPSPVLGVLVALLALVIARILTGTRATVGRVWGDG